jgi:hypothetical protein
VSDKIRALAKTTELGCYERGAFNQGTGKYESRKWRFQWAIAIGMFTTRTDLHATRGRPELPGYDPANGFGLMNASPAYLWLSDYKIEMLGKKEPCP